MSAYAVSRVPALEVLLEIGLWFVAMLLVHDFVLFPLYAAADNIGAFFRWAFPRTGRVSWVNHVRFPAVWSALLLLAWFPLVLRLSPKFERDAARRDDPFLWHWLLVTAALFCASLLVYVIRRRMARRSAVAR
jgi:hypothetical protein